jgi:hypothetical protein
MEIVKSYSLYFNTRQANSGTSDNCTFLFPTPLILTNSNNRFQISTPMIELPYSFSQINANNNLLSYNYSDSLGNSYTNGSFSFPIGNYNINQLQTQFIESLLTNIYVRIPSSTLSTSNFLISYTSQSGLGTYYMMAGFTVTIVLKFSLNYVLGIMFGFSQTNQTFGTAVKLTSNQKIMVNPITSVYLRSENLKFQSNQEAVISPMTNADIICKIPVTTLPNSIIYFRSDYPSIISNNNLASLNLYLSDNLSTTYTLNMGGVNYGIMVRIDEIQLKPVNSYQDILPMGELKPPKELLNERENLLNELINKKKELEKEIVDAQKKKLKSIEDVNAHI